MESHAEVPDAADRGDTIGILTTQDAQRLVELVPIRHGRMIATPFTFYRGRAATMTADLAKTPTPDIQVHCAVTPTCRTSGSTTVLIVASYSI